MALTRNDRIAFTDAEIEAFCRKHHIRKLALFGSVLRDDFDLNSDVDVLVEFEPDAVVGFFELMSAQQDFAELIGREVDMNTSGFLSKHFRDQVVAEAQVLYESQ
ncbi:MAG: nucleotidyltransferase domain-containing protein [Anaerolineae bacterium]|nr:nucleotidyltransferase domain-containing protein [Anaerolineae bacterium]